MSRDARTLGGIVYAKLRDCGSDMATRDALSELIALAMHGEAERPAVVSYLLRVAEGDAEKESLRLAASALRQAAAGIQEGRHHKQNSTSVTR